MQREESLRFIANGGWWISIKSIRDQPPSKPLSGSDGIWQGIRLAAIQRQLRGVGFNLRQFKPSWFDFRNSNGKCATNIARRFRQQHHGAGQFRIDIARSHCNWANIKLLLCLCPCAFSRRRFGSNPSDHALKGWGSVNALHREMRRPRFIRGLLMQRNSHDPSARRGWMIHRRGNLRQRICFKMAACDHQDHGTNHSLSNHGLAGVGGAEDVDGAGDVDGTEDVDGAGDVDGAEDVGGAVVVAGGGDGTTAASGTAGNALE